MYWMAPAGGWRGSGDRRRGKLLALALALHRTVLLLLAVALPISLLWVTTTGCVVKLLGQDKGVADAAQTFARVRGTPWPTSRCWPCCTCCASTSGRRT